MRLIIVWSLIASVGIAALAWGWSVGGKAVPPRPGDQTVSVLQAWYASVPADPQAATEAYLQRIPASTRARGEQYSDSRMLAFEFRIATVLLATLLLCSTRLAAAARHSAAQAIARVPVVDAVVALQYFLALYLLSLPAEIYATYVRPHRFGFSDQPFGAWLGDSLINWGVLTAFYLIAVLAIYAFIRRRPTQWVAWAVGVYLVLRMTYTLLLPGVIEPLTNSFRPLADGQQRQQILALAHANGIGDVMVVTGDASRQTRLLNAHVSGIWGTARISVDDTTLRATSDPMLRAVVGHEIGHYVMNHELQSAITDTLIMSVGFALIALGTRAIVRRFGPGWNMAGVSDIASLPVFWGLFVLWGFASLPVSNAVSREYERQADLYGLNASQAPHGLAEFMIHDADTVRVKPTALEYALFYSHPSDAERVATAMQWRAAQAQLPGP